MKNNIQGIFVTGTLVFFARVDARVIDGKTIPAFNKVQVSIISPSGFSVIDIKDTDFLVSDNLLNKVVTLQVSIASYSGNTYYKLISIIS